MKPYGRGESMRILHITRDFPPRVRGGLSVAVGGMARAQAEQGMRVAVISFDGYRPRGGGAPPGPARAEDNGQVFVIRISAPAQLGDARAFGRGAHPDVIHVHDPMLFPLGAELRTELGAPVVFTRHVAHSVQDRLRGLSAPTASARAEADAAAGADLVHAPSRAAAADLPETAAPRVRVMPLGAEPPAPPPRGASGRDRRGGPVVYAGRFTDVRGARELVNAIPRILASVPDASFILAGGIPDSPRAESRFRRRLGQALSPAERARVTLPGWLSGDALAELYDEAAAVVVPSWFETFGLAAAESMLRAAPIAAANTGGLAEILADGDTASLFEPGDVDGIASRVAALLTAPERAARMGLRAAAWARERLVWDRVIGAFIEAYRELRRD